MLLTPVPKRNLAKVRNTAMATSFPISFHVGAMAVESMSAPKSSSRATVKHFQTECELFDW